MSDVVSSVYHANIHVLGKGNDRCFMTSAFDIAREHTANLKWSDVIVVGDNPMTDIAGGLQMGATTVLVTSGMENDHQKLYYNRPHLVADTLEDLVSTDVTHFSFVDIVTRQALNMHKMIHYVTSHSLFFCLSGLSKAPLRKTQSLPSRLNEIP